MVIFEVNRYNPFAFSNATLPPQTISTRLSFKFIRSGMKFLLFSIFEDISAQGF